MQCYFVVQIIPTLFLAIKSLRSNILLHKNSSLVTSMEFMFYNSFLRVGSVDLLKLDAHLVYR